MTEAGSTAGTAQQLFNAARNFRALAANFGLIDADILDDSLAQGLSRLLETLRTSMGRIQVLTGAEIRKPDTPAEQESRQDLHLDPSKLQKAIDFSSKVSRWLDSVEADNIPGRAKAVLKELGTAVRMTEEIVDSLIKDYSGAAQAGIRPSSSQGTPELIMTNSRQSPLLEEWHGQPALNKKAKTLLREYLDLIGFPDGQREIREWERKTEKWLLAAPKGMILVLRMGSYGDKPTIYPKYLPKNSITEHS